MFICFKFINIVITIHLFLILYHLYSIYYQFILFKYNIIIIINYIIFNNLIYNNFNNLFILKTLNYLKIVSIINLIVFKFIYNHYIIYFK